MKELKDLFTKSNHIYPSLGDAGAHVSQIMDAGWSTFILSYWHPRAKPVRSPSARRYKR